MSAQDRRSVVKELSISWDFKAHLNKDFFYYLMLFQIPFVDLILWGESSPIQWSVCWTLGPTAQVQVLAGAWRCVLKQDASLTLLRIHSRIAPFFALNRIFFLANEEVTLKTKQPVRF